MGVGDISTFGVLVLLVSLAVLLALVGNRIGRAIRVPAPALFLVGAAVASDVRPSLGHLSHRLDERIVTVALVVVLFDGGMGIGWRRLRRTAGAVLWVGVVGTLLTAAGVAVAAHLLFGFGWRGALLLGTALAPTDPAVVFSVLGGREIAGRSGTLLEGESGANDPVGIALLVAVLGATGGGASAVLGGVGQFAVQMAVGLAVGVGGGLGLRWVVRHVPLPEESLYPVRALAGAAALYGLAAAAHGSGFLAVFVAGILLGDADAPYQSEVERFGSALSSLGEIVAFTVLGLTISVRPLLTSPDLAIGLALAALLVLVVRPALVGLLLLPLRLGGRERLFVMWAGLKGAVPVLLGLLVVSSGTPGAERLYGIVFVVVLVSVVAQGGSIPLVIRLLRIPVSEHPPQPYATGLRLRRAPDGLHRFTIAPGAAADGARVRELGLGNDAWLSLASRGGELLALRREQRLRAGDEVLVHGDPAADLEALFTGARRGGSRARGPFPRRGDTDAGT